MRITGISPANVAPVAGDDEGAGFETDEASAFTTGSVLLNDSDGDGGTLSVSGLDTTGTQGAVTDNGDGTFDYDPNGAFDGLEAGQSATDQFSYTLSDGQGGTDQATVTVRITGKGDPSPNTAPVAVDDGPSIEFIVGETDILTTLSLLTNDTDADADPLSIIAVQPNNPLVKVTNNGDGTITYDPNGAYNALSPTGLRGGPPETDTDTVTYTVSDGRGGIDTAVVTITIFGTTSANNQTSTPRAVDDGPGNGFETGEAQAFTTPSVLLNDSDPDNGPLSVVGIDTAATLGTVIDNGDGTFDYDPGSAFLALNAGETATDRFTYTLYDGQGRTDTAIVRILINGGGPNFVPEANDDGPGNGFETYESTPFVTPSVLTNDSDFNNGILSLAGFDTTGTLGSVIDNGDGTFTYDPGTAFLGLGIGETGTDSFSYTLSDGQGGTDKATVTITINGGDNFRPDAVDDAGVGFTTDAETPFTLPDLLANDMDRDPTDTLLIAAFDEDATMGDVTATRTGSPQFYVPTSFVYDPNGAFESLGQGETATDQFFYAIVDRRADGSFPLNDDPGSFDTAVVTVTVIGVNDAPTAQSDGGTGFRVNEDETFTTDTVLENDSDPDTTDVLSVTGLDTTATIGLVTDNGDGTFDYDPNGMFDDLDVDRTIPQRPVPETATDSFRYTITDSFGLTSTATVTITISGVSDDDGGGGPRGGFARTTIAESSVAESDPADALLDLTNDLRLANGLAPVALDTALIMAAQQHADDMADNDFVSHTGSDGSTPGGRAVSAGFNWSSIGENIAAGQASAEAAFAAWTESPGHLETILDPMFTDLGIGYANRPDDTGDADYQFYWTQLFASEASVPEADTVPVTDHAYDDVITTDGTTIVLSSVTTRQERGDSADGPDYGAVGGIAHADDVSSETEADADQGGEAQMSPPPTVESGDTSNAVTMASHDVPSGGLMLDGSDANDWRYGARQDITLTNNSDQTISDWTVKIDLDPGALANLTFTNVYRADWTTDGEDLFFTPLFYTREIAPGETEFFGLNVDVLDDTGLPWDVNDISLI